MALVISTTHSLILLSFVFLLHNDCDFDFLICQGFFFFNLKSRVLYTKIVILVDILDTSKYMY